MFGNVFLNIVALTMTTVSTVALLQPTQPVIASVLTTCLGHERMSFQKGFGILLSCVGSLVMALWQNGSAGKVNFGILVVLAQCLSGANYVVQQRPLVLTGYSPLTVSSCAYVVATVLTVITGGIYFAVLSPTQRNNVEWYQPTALFFLVLVYVVFLTTVYNYVVMAWATGKLGATLVTLFGLLQGIFASFVEWRFFGHPLSLIEALAALAIFAGLIMVVTAPGRAGYVDTRATWAAALSAPSISHLSVDSESAPSNALCSEGFYAANAAEAGEAVKSPHSATAASPKVSKVLSSGRTEAEERSMS